MTKTWTYSITLHQMPRDAYKLVDPPDVDTLPVIDTVTGTVEANDYPQAHAKAWNAASIEIKARKQSLGLGILQVAQQNNGKLEVVR